jgi:hypothetical protein
MISQLRRLSMVATVAIAASALLVPSASADTFQPLNAAGIEQTVLRAQPSKALGPWRQNIYYTWATNDKRFFPTVCFKANGDFAQLPAPKKGGGVGYEYDSNISGGTTLFQYADQAKADAALAKMRGFTCPNSTKVRTDVGSVVQGKQKAAFTDAAKTSLTMVVAYSYDGGAGMMDVVQITSTTQRGLAIVQTEVFLAGPATKARTVNAAVALNKDWHARAVAAYEAFGTDKSQ